MFKENKDYEFVPAPNTDEDAWCVRILTGAFTETVVQYGTIRFNENDINEDGMEMTFNFDVIETPDPEAIPDNPELQNVVGDMLLQIIENAISNNELISKEVNVD